MVLRPVPPPWAGDVDTRFDISCLQPRYPEGAGVFFAGLNQLPLLIFAEKIYNHLYDETKKNYESKNSTVIKSIRNSFK